MPSFLIDPELAHADGPPTVIAVVHGDDYPRRTPRHAHARGQLLGAQRGLLTIGVDAGHWVVPAVHAVWLPPHCPHELSSHGPFNGWSAYIAESACARMPGEPRVLSASGLLREAVARAATWAGIDRAPAEVCLEEVILAEIATTPREDLGLPMPREPRLQTVAKAVLAELADARGAEDWSRQIGMSSRTFQRHFAAETGLGFTAWRQRARLLRALEMLANGQPVTTIALDLGYQNVGAFIDMFRRHFGTTPSRYATKT